MTVSFTNQTQVLVPNPYAPDVPDVIVKDTLGARAIAGIDDSTPSMIGVYFGRPESGTIDLAITEVGGGGAGTADDIVADAVIGRPARAVVA